MPSDYIFQHSPTALFLIRASLEQGSARPLRAHIRQTADVSHGFEGASIVTDIESVVASVRLWLESLDLASSADATDAPSDALPIDRGGAAEGLGDAPDGDSPAWTNGVAPGH